jgi:hypothetical protein
MNKFSVLSVAVLSICGVVNAGITPAIISGSPTPSGSDFMWSYEISLNNQEQLVSGNYATCQGGVACGTFYTVYDFAGFVNVVTAGPHALPSNWGYVVNANGITPSGQIINNDDPSTENITFIYNGPPSVQQGPISNLQGFNILSSLGTSNPNGVFSYQLQRIANPSASDQGQGPITVPGLVAVPLSAQPEPASILLIGGGLIGIGTFRRKLFRASARQA